MFKYQRINLLKTFCKETMVMKTPNTFHTPLLLNSVNNILFGKG